MRSSTVLSALFAVGALSSPIGKRDIVTDLVIVTVTDYVTAGQALPTSASTWGDQYMKQHTWNHDWSSAAASSTASAPVSSSSSSSVPGYVAPSSSSSSIYVAPTSSSDSVYVAPTSSTSSSAYVAPPSSTSSAYVAPSSTAAASQAPASTSSSTPAAASAASTSISAPAASGTDYVSQALYHHNVHRANHSASDLTWDDGLASIAAGTAASCVYAHDTTAGGGGYGQNIAAGVQSSDIGSVISDLFYNREEMNYAGMYGQASPDMSNFDNWGHFSQIVWQGTTTVGCATQACPGGLANTGSDVPPYFTVCNYKTPGNYAGEYTNVGSPLGNPVVTGSSS
ncbi:MAG: hypothetical protein M1827_003438 [Pycnora praestabilis]|nr:MAG: hypothetical protein M1827_003438 [Pycnora praestabilis]